MTDWIRRWVEDSPYGRTLGVGAETIESDRARLTLPYRDDNSNGDRALHGGVAASMVALGSHAVARAALGEDSGPWHIAAVQVSYLSAALGEGIAADARLLRRGKELAYVDVEVRSESDRTVARGLATVRGRFGAADAKPPEAAGDDGASDRGPMGPFIQRVPFHAKLGLSAEHMSGGRARIALPWSDANADASGGLHEGALLALLDTTGAMAAWAHTGPGRFKASTPGIQARVLAPPARGDLIGFGRVRHSDRELHFSDIEIARTDDRRLVAQGSVQYRIVTPDLER